MKYFLAFDLGASSGRAILGSLAAGRLEIEEVHRFDNGAIDINGSLHWDLLGLFSEMKVGLKKVLARGVTVSGLAIDTWGVDFALIDRHGSFVGFPYHYRDKRTSDILPYAFARMPRDDFYARTGIQFMNLNTIFQLASMKRDDSPALGIADKLLMMPNALTYLFCGNVSAEYTDATTSQAYDPVAGDWAWDIIDALELPRKLFPAIVAPGTAVGELRPAICEDLGCEPIPLILVGSHDTASAVAAVPARPGREWAYLSSGTWSLCGVELDEPCISSAGMAANYTNEGGIAGKIRFLKNIMGLWLIQESRSEWARQGRDYDYGELAAMAAEAAPFRSLVDPNDDSFMAPGNMPERIAAFCARVEEPEPRTVPEVVRCAFESLALRYRQTLDEIEQITGRRIELLHLVGGGSQNELLNEFTANAVNRPVIAGPVEATAIGNIICQGMAVGDIADLSEAREIVCNSFQTREYQPTDAEAWDAAYQRYIALM